MSGPKVSQPRGLHIASPGKHMHMHLGCCMAWGYASLYAASCDAVCVLTLFYHSQHGGSPDLQQQRNSLPRGNYKPGDMVPGQ